MVINEFNGDYRWLSNFHILESPLEYNGITYKTTEHFYQSMKSNDINENRKIAAHPLKGLKAYCRTIPVVSGWDDTRLIVMAYAIRYKFSEKNPRLRSMLVNTGDTEIIEGNRWNDKFWGVCLKTGEGENNLGKIIMKVREEIINAIQ